MHDLAGKNHAKNVREKLFHVNKFKFMSLNVGKELRICEGNGPTFIKTAWLIWVPKHLCLQKIFYEYTLNLNQDKDSTLTL